MKIYFSGSIKGGREHQAWYEYMIPLLGRHGEVLTEFVSDKSLTSYGSLNMTPEEIYNRDILLIQESDVIVADITVPSLGVGYEISYAENLGKRIYCLYHQVSSKTPSSMIVGNPHCEIHAYETKEDVEKIISQIFKHHEKE